MSTYAPFLLVIALLFVSGCDSNRAYVEDGPSYPVAAGDSPEIRNFALVDSLRNDSDDTRTSLVLDPLEDFGVFEIYWEVDSFYDYTVGIYLNDVPGVAGAIEIGWDYCGSQEGCDVDGYQVCQYTDDAVIGCGWDLDDAQDFASYIGDLLYTFPQDAYLSIEVCPSEGGYHCETRSLPVTLY